jgi:uncharacterized protein
MATLGSGGGIVLTKPNERTHTRQCTGAYWAIDIEVTEQRRSEFTAVIAHTKAWASSRSDIKAIGLAGSWARGQASMSSDADLVVLTDDADPYVGDTRWIGSATGQLGEIIRTKAWGPLIERRVKLPSGFLIEYGFAPLSWADVAPLDPENAEIVANGFRILYDPEGILRRLVSVVEDWRSRRSPRG